MAMVYPNSCDNEMCYKGTALYWRIATNTVVFYCLKVFQSLLKQAENVAIILPLSSWESSCEYP